MAKMIFLSLPVSDLKRATAFYQAIGASPGARRRATNATLPSSPSSSPFHATKPTGDAGSRRAKAPAQASMAAIPLALSSAPGVVGTLS